MSKNRFENEGDGLYTLRDVPIFEMHENRGFECNEEWMKGAIANFNSQKAAGYRPVVIIGHNVKGQEKENQGFVDNLKLKGQKLYADITRVSKSLKEKILSNAYPSRSVEARQVGPFLSRSGAFPQQSDTCVAIMHI